MPKKQFLLAHLSDLHLSPEYFPERSASFRSVLDQCKARNVDHIVISGDITNQAKQREFEHFRAILNEYGLLDSNKVTVVIGNHDIFGGPYHAEDVLEFPSKCKATSYEEKVREFYHYTRETFSGSKFFTKDSIYPFVKTVGDIAFVGINSVAKWSAMNNPLGSNGHVDDEQFELLESILKSSILKEKRVFVVVHHHFNKLTTKQGASKLERLWAAIESSTMKLRKKKRLVKLFSKAGVAAVLHGHVHHTETYQRKSIRFFNAGGSLIPSKNSQRLHTIFSLHARGFDATMHPAPHIPSKKMKKAVKQTSRLLAVA